MEFGRLQALGCREIATGNVGHSQQKERVGSMTLCHGLLPQCWSPISLEHSQLIRESFPSSPKVSPVTECS